MARRTKADAPAAPQPGYAAWKARVREIMQQAGVPSGDLRERDLRDLFIGGATPERAAEQAGVTAHNARPSFGRPRHR